MSYSAELHMDITFRSHRDLNQYVQAAHIPSDAATESRDVAWVILAGLSEYAVGTLDGLRLTGRGTGRLLHGYPKRVRALAHHATGTITAIAEDDTRWLHQLEGGQAVTLHHGAGTPDVHPRSTIPTTHTSQRCPDRSRTLAAGSAR